MVTKKEVRLRLNMPNKKFSNSFINYNANTDCNKNKNDNKF